MAETIVSPGVLAIENDNSFITEQPIQAGAAIIGPTVKGKVGIPTICTTYSDYSNKFGTTFESGSQTFTYFTSISAYNYFQNGGTSLLVTRVVSGSFTPATSSRIPTSIANTQATANINLTFISASLAQSISGSESYGVNGITFFYTGSDVANTSTQININTGSFNDSTLADYAFSSSEAFNFSSSLTSYNTSLLDITSTISSPSLILNYTGQNGITGNNSYFTSGSVNYSFSGGTNTEMLVLETLTEGEIMNSNGTLYTNGSLLSGSEDNVRWQITNQNIVEGTFELVVRRGDDTTLSPTTLETWSNLSLDPYSSNYVEKIIGNQTQVVSSDNGEYFVDVQGNYPNKSRYIRVKRVNVTTPKYFDNTGDPKPQFTGSLPTTSSGAFGSAIGSNISSDKGMYYENVSNTNIQGLQASDYTDSISLLANKNAYQYNLITTPGLISDFANHISSITKIINTVQTRGDSMTVIDLVRYGANINTVTTQATTYDTSYAASYWPWVKTIDPDTSRQVWVPASTMIPSVYAFNDSVAEPWFAPAGINRGVMSTTIRAERNLTQGNRDTLYQNKINGIVSFPNTGITVFGQKTLQKRKSALDRVNVRRLLIELKRFISQVADTLVFEQNTTSTRSTFLSQVNPYLSSIQNRQGLSDFKVVMDETNNTPTTIDNNQLIGQIFLQPIKSAEFIILDFNVLPTGATFPT
tara:strand:+ start:1334 stop:3430 length:2097 start_codon:yes stop_codon:yes gene_type:complete